MMRDVTVGATDEGTARGIYGEAHLRSVLSTVPEAMVIIDPQGAILSFSAVAEQMFGYAEADVMGENVSMLMPSPDRERHDGYLDHFLRTGERRMIGLGRITTARRRDGFTFPIELAVGEATGPDGRVFTGFIRDLSERQDADSRLQTLQVELAHVTRVSAMGSLASALAHELNQPLTAIANYMEGARDLIDADEPDKRALLREALDEAAGQAIRAGEIVRRLRDFMTRGETQRQVESLSRLVMEANVLALVGAGEKGVEVRVALDPSADDVLVDRIPVQQVMLNLIRNALEAMMETPVRHLEIVAEPDGAMVHVAVADSGPGIHADVAARLFEPFLSTKEHGMGIGLSICRTIIEAQGGRIWNTASPLGGTAFHFTLPRARVEEADG